MPAPNDIPVAQRVASTPKERRSTADNLARSFKALPWWGYSLAVVAFFLPLLGTRLILAKPEANGIIPLPNEQATTTPVARAIPPSGTEVAKDPSDSSPTVQGNPESSSNPLVLDSPEGRKIKHYPYEEAPIGNLLSVGRAADGYDIRLREPAARSFLEMAAAAKTEGIELVPISGFRTKTEQRQLFFEISKQRNQTPTQRAMVSAPPGYSEHHTGYAIDLGDGANPSTNLSRNFENTAAFKWLEQNAAKFSFELSFPLNNSQGVMYEPWHWRFVGDDNSLATFYKHKPQQSTTSEIEQQTQSATPR